MCRGVRPGSEAWSPQTGNIGKLRLPPEHSCPPLLYSRGMSVADVQAKWKDNVVRVVAMIVGLAFVASGAMKLAGVEEAAKRFQEFSYPLWFMYLIVAIEIGSGIAMVIPMLRFWGASLLICTMIGAIYSHAKIGEGAGEIIPPGVLLVLCAVVAWAACPFCGKTVIAEASRR